MLRQEGKVSLILAMCLAAVLIGSVGQIRQANAVGNCTWGCDSAQCYYWSLLGYRYYKNPCLYKGNWWAWGKPRWDTGGVSLHGNRRAWSKPGNGRVVRVRSGGCEGED